MKKYNTRILLIFVPRTKLNKYFLIEICLFEQKKKKMSLTSFAHLWSTHIIHKYGGLINITKKTMNFNAFANCWSKAF